MHETSIISGEGTANIAAPEAKVGGSKQRL